jgi:hypothetical protein
MPPTLNNDVRINDVVYDFMTIEIVNPCLHQQILSYSIIDASQRIIRKGNFIGNAVHLRVAHMSEGNYLFCIKSKDDRVSSIPFKKVSASFNELSFVLK